MQREKNGIELGEEEKVLMDSSRLEHEKALVYSSPLELLLLALLV